MKISLIFLLLFLTSCVSTINKFAFNKKLKGVTEIQIKKGSDFKINISEYKLGNEIDSLMNVIFRDKNLKLVNSKSKYVLVFNKFNYEVIKKRAEAKDNLGFSTGQYGNQLNINLIVNCKIVDTLTKREEKFTWKLGDVKTVSTDFMFDFFAVDSEDSFSPSIPLKNCFNAMSQKTVKFIQNNEK